MERLNKEPKNRSTCFPGSFLRQSFHADHFAFLFGGPAKAAGVCQLYGRPENVLFVVEEQALIGEGEFVLPRSKIENIIFLRG